MGHFARTRAMWTDGADVVTAADLESFEQKMFKALNGDEGGTWAPTSPIIVGGNGLTLLGSGHQLGANAQFFIDSTAEMVNDSGTFTNHGVLTNETDGTILFRGTTKPSLAARTLTRVQGLPIPDDWTLVGFNGTTMTFLGFGNSCFYELSLPHGCKLNSVSVALVGASSHTGLPSIMPTVSVHRAADGAQTTLGIATDASATTGDYEQWHNITVGGLNHTVDRAYRYVAQFNGEANTNALVHLKVAQCAVNFDVSMMDDGAS